MSGACELLFRRKGEAARRFASLRAAGYAVRAYLGGETLWLPRAHSVWDAASFARQRAAGWFAARLFGSGGRYGAGKAFFPDGSEMAVAVVPYDRLPPPPCVVVLVLGAKEGRGLVPPGAYWCREEDLAVSDLPACLNFKNDVE
ncbi:MULTISPECIES: hypothetical protein [unclassified Neomoorella]|uniref:hypothetical protein n=1 Tax=unclassified Neomoorella TaxID=2676739 RepID=UPI001143A536|nr:MULTISPECIES: hypothetical protein [unclassified Moorella (in: firmicutes)]